MKDLKDCKVSPWKCNNCRHALLKRCNIPSQKEIDEFKAKRGL